MTYSQRGIQPEIPSIGKKNTKKFFGCVSLYSGQFTYSQTNVFNTDTHIPFLKYTLNKYSGQKIFLIQDNAKYHKNPEIFEWYNANRDNLEVYFIPPYSPELNAIEKVWKFTRTNSTHNVYFPNETDLVTAVTNSFRKIQKSPDLIMNYLYPYF